MGNLLGEIKNTVYTNIINQFEGIPAYKHFKISSTGIAHFVLSTSHKYSLIQETKTWDEAQEYCQATHTDLAIIKSSDDMVQLQYEAQMQSFNSDAWIGLYLDIESWRCSFNNTPLVVQLWCLGEPDNEGGLEECGAADSILGWLCSSDAPCNSLMPIL